MKYLFIAGVCLVGIVVISIRDTDLADIKDLADIQAKVVTGGIESDNELNASTNPEWNKYWYAGVAELSGYSLKQSRYGEIHEGQATMIFVTEPFSRKKQVKLDNPGAAGDDKLSVLKLNSTRAFLTGIYPYNMMTSVFSPIDTKDYASALKLTLSGQEWCGQVYMQMNQRGGKFDVDSYSYFESEGDNDFSLENSYLEDELYSLIRLNPGLLPKGNVTIIPSAVASRFMHEDMKSYEARATIGTNKWQGKEVSQYTLKYTHNSRIVNIYFQSEFPFIIEGWDDTYQGFDKEPLTSVAVRQNTKLLDYWNKHDNKDRYLNKELYK